MVTHEVAQRDPDGYPGPRRNLGEEPNRQGSKEQQPDRRGQGAENDEWRPRVAPSVVGEEEAGESGTQHDRTGGGDHFLNFINAVRTRDKASLNAPIEEGYISSTLIYLANASYRLGKTIEFDPDSLQVVNDDDANRMLRSADRGYRKPFYIPENV